MATAVGGPTTLPGTLLTVPNTFTGVAPRSRMVIESGVGLSALLVTPFSCLTLWSFDEGAIGITFGCAGRRSGHTQSMLVGVEQRFLFLALRGVDTAQRDHLAHGLD